LFEGQHGEFKHGGNDERKKERKQVTDGQALDFYSFIPTALDKWF
jgi:hypothetical protein